MKFRFLIILGFCFCKYSQAQTLPSSLKKPGDSIVRVHSNDELLPPEFRSPAQENEYDGDSGPDKKYGMGNYSFVFKFRSNCTFFYEVYYKPYDTARVGYYIGKYTMSGNKINLTYDSMLPGEPKKNYASPSLPVPWSLPERPKYLSVKKTGLISPTTKKQKSKIRYTLKGKSQFDLGSCK